MIVENRGGGCREMEIETEYRADSLLSNTYHDSRGNSAATRSPKTLDNDRLDRIAVCDMNAKEACRHLVCIEWTNAYRKWIGDRGQIQNYSPILAIHMSYMVQLGHCRRHSCSSQMRYRPQTASFPQMIPVVGVAMVILVRNLDRHVCVNH